MAEILDGKKIKKLKEETLAREVMRLGMSHQLTLAVIQIGDREDSAAYIASKKKFAEAIGVVLTHIHLDETVSSEKVLEHIRRLNDDKTVHGIIIQLPVPLTLEKELLLNAVAPQKDVDALGAVALERLWEGREDALMPATTRGILSLLDHYHIPLEGKKVTIVGRSSLVGKPTALACLNSNATVTICHSKTLYLKEETRKADILIVAIGRPLFITKEYVKPGQVVIDVGINSPQLGKIDEDMMLPKLIGDVDYTEVKEIVAHITPVPGGVGQLTVASLFENLIDAYKRFSMHE